MAETKVTQPSEQEKKPMKLNQKVETGPEINERDPKPTPGPWEVGYGSGITGPRCAPSIYWDDVDDIAAIPIRHDEQVIAWVAASVDLRKETRAEGEARLLPDAHVLAASWELLEALKELVRVCAHSAGGLGGNLAGKRIMSHVDVSRAIIAKAEGRATGSEYGSRDSSKLGRPKP